MNRVIQQHHKRVIALVAAGVITLTGCATLMAPNYEALTEQMMKSSFRDEGIAKAGRLEQDASNRECSLAGLDSLPEARAKAIEAENLKSIKWPSDGKFLGDWREGERIAQSGRGMTWTDPTAQGNGGNCYNCHKISEQEISFGTIGPSLHQYGKLRGVTDPASPAAKAIVEYTWGKIFNAKAYNACSGMPRLGHSGVLTEQQIQHLMALLLDPKSPVNQ